MIRYHFLHHYKLHHVRYLSYNLPFLITFHKHHKYKDQFLYHIQEFHKYVSFRNQI
ncbi:hypothetical protein GLOIN_2v1591689 [Rhizophagus irregularis DAOM 181602=DAOM 197198]|uniref:Uncharacterized protein n=1 Tax=Rhizophagus irregularis (strain DAOM 181602 / DAOM 197198 / MUCL 43194) TaxID=747089 RepID=A0A2P4Q5G4_RHIID|nr:hypothetical protein GLOIN_2v1591689 [Rhizophagus irregularis DAOM 181602=DAOM 197198]POG72886.1 hypothetical protein GLOIN_2v1591689 [Rhizophagus irregularis DAOM 181602=DAOM 197198]|eukprot:XP_025179752.1 hypothetical protein GLOIN_2v1591689 [Rhizophagus irregularis DAOM 181602=DAOM 197198]